MSSEDDEDVIFEILKSFKSVARWQGSELYTHLVNSAYDGPEIEFYNSGKFSQETKLLDNPANKVTSKQVVLSYFLKWWTKLGFIVSDHEEEFNQRIVNLIWSSSLVLVEDVDFITNMFDEKLSTNIIKPCGQTSYCTLLALGGAALTVTIFSSTVFPWALRLPSLIYAGFSVARLIDKGFQDWNHQKFQVVVASFEATLSRLQDFCSTLAKVLQFIQEMELIDRGFTLPNLISHLSIKTRPGHTSALLCSPLRKEIMDILQELHHLARESTLNVRDQLPLNNAIDNPSHYVACSETPMKTFEDEETISLQTIRSALRHCHIQLSEMLRRLALCFLLPNHKQHVALINELNETLPNRIQPLNHRLQVAYKYFAAWKVSDHSGSHSSHSATSDGANVRSANLDLALHSLDRHLRATALLIDSIRAEENKASLRNQLSHECKAVATCWELVEMEFIKSTGPRQTSSQSAQETAPLARRNEPADHGDAVPLCGPWEPDVEDLEILEADLENEPYERLARSDDDDDLFMLRETRQERLARKREMAAQSRRLYSELQVVLKSKAQEWKEREARVMERLGKPIEQEVAIEEEPRDALRTPHAEEASPTGKDDANDARSPMPIEQRARVDAKFDTTGVPASNFSVQASLAAQVRALASQRTVQHEDLIGDSDDAESTDSYVTEDD